MSRNLSSTIAKLPYQLKYLALRYRLSILSGLLIGTSYIPFPPWALFFCLTPLFVFWVKRAENKKQVFFAGWLTQFILNLIGFHWIGYTAIEFGHFPLWGGVLSLLMFAAVAHLYYPLSGLIGFILSRRLNITGSSAVMVYVFSFALVENVVYSTFPWHLGYPWLWAGWPGAQLADVIGFEGLNVATILVNGLVAMATLALTTNERNRVRIAIPLGLGIGLIAMINLLGMGREMAWKKSDAELNFLAVQPNIGNFEKFMVELKSDFRRPIVDKMLTLTRQGLAAHPESQMVLWPETAFPAALDAPFLGGNLQAEVRVLLSEKQVSLLTGGYSKGSGQNEFYNGVFFLNTMGLEPLPAYRKTILLVFGETFPLSDVIPYMPIFFPDQGNFNKGSGPQVWNLKIAGRKVAIGPQICYEGLYPWFSARLAEQGAQILVNVTNDSWFWHPFEPNQHLYMTLARAIEFRRPMIRATNTGITTAITAAGEVLEKSPIGTEWSGEYKIPYLENPDHTLFESLEKWCPWILAAGLALSLAFGLVVGLKSSDARIPGSKT